MGFADGSVDSIQLLHRPSCNLHVGCSTDGIFWMLFEDFLSHYAVIYHCRLVRSNGWVYKSLADEWVAGQSAGGTMCSNTFHTNPQFKLTATAKKCSVTVMVSQAVVRDGKAVDDTERVYMGIYAFDAASLASMTGANGRFTRTPRQSTIVAKSKAFSSSRDVMIELEVSTRHVPPPLS